MLKIYAWDIETSDLKADWGWIVCAVVKDVNTGKTWKYRIDNQPRFRSDRSLAMDDKLLVQELQERLSEADLWITQYGTRFDERFVRTRAIHHGLSAMPPVSHLDVWRAARQYLLLTSNRQGSINEILNVRNQKYHVSRRTHQLARIGDREAITSLLTYCENDVDGLIENYLGLRSLIRNHPFVAKTYSVEDPHGVCPSCGTVGAQRRGFYRTKLQVRERRHCQGCGQWFFGKASKAR